MSIKCTLQNPDRSRRSSGYFSSTVFEYYEYTHATLWFTVFKIGKNLISDTARMCKSQLSHFCHSKRFTNNSIVKDPTHPLPQSLPAPTIRKTVPEHQSPLGQTAQQFFPWLWEPWTQITPPPSETPCTPLPPETWTTPQPYHTKKKTVWNFFLYNSKCATHRWVGLYKTTCSKHLSSIRGANLSPFGEICRFHLEIGHSRESCRSVKKYLRGGGGA